VTRKKKAKEAPIALISSATTGTVTINVEPSVAQVLKNREENRKLVKAYLLEKFAELLDDIL